MGRINPLIILRKINGRRGFTLVEVVLALSIFSLILGITLPELQKPLAHYQLRSTAMQLASDLRWLRQQSIYGKAVMINLQVVPSSGYYLIRENTKAVIHRSLPPGIKFRQVVLKSNQLHFTLTGAPDMGGRIVLENSFGEVCTVYIMPATGRIRVEIGVAE